MGLWTLCWDSDAGIRTQEWGDGAEHNPAEDIGPGDTAVPVPTPPLHLPPPSSFPSFLVFGVHNYRVRFGGSHRGGFGVGGNMPAGTGTPPERPGKGLTALYRGQYKRCFSWQAWAGGLTAMKTRMAASFGSLILV